MKVAFSAMVETPLLTNVASTPAIIELSNEFEEHAHADQPQYAPVEWAQRQAIQPCCCIHVCGHRRTFLCFEVRHHASDRQTQAAGRPVSSSASRSYQCV